mmetsp:Transcript_7094/g.7810  ORF Transcript_7094/g.7810 Transcript_7094/m.7810 type:complete len:219 (-) Transcript_7094:243-899(-)
MSQNTNSSYKYEETDNLIVTSNYELMILSFGIGVILFLLSFLFIFLLVKKEKNRVAKMTNFLKIISILLFVSSFPMLYYLSNMWIFLKMAAVFLIVAMGAFARDNFGIRIFYICCCIGLITWDFLRNVEISYDLDCYLTERCTVDTSLFWLKLLWIRNTVALALQSYGILMCGAICNITGWMYTKKYAKTLDLEKYHMERPKNPFSIYDYFPHSTYSV